jgi:2-iminobutanoate/2-iminopropanoate deaminase
VAVYVAGISLWDEIDAACRHFFGAHKPARSVVPTRGLHDGFKVEIEVAAA